MFRRRLKNLPDDNGATRQRAPDEREQARWPTVNAYFWRNEVCFCTTCREVAGAAKWLRLRRPDLSLQNDGITRENHGELAVAPVGWSTGDPPATSEAQTDSSSL
jgi:hypothetical protein